MYTGKKLDNKDKGKLILMLQLRQLSNFTSLLSFLQAHHIAFIFLENAFGLYFCHFFVNKVIPMQLPIKGLWPVQG